ncbi:MAG: glycosyltransferase [Leptospiraceae bacterium]|nr:glycosyltransferase [Leptospiraceae bacterium]MCP5511196.1 glycosyltransferase [Leptospiraceae bacterium]
MSRHVLIAAGGTGGHISPGIALVEYLSEHKEDLGISDITIHSLYRNRDNPDLIDSPVPVQWHNLPQLNWKSLYKLPIILFHILKSILSLKKLGITDVIAMGGYSCLPSLLYAVLFKKNIYLCEQNRIIGKVVRLFQSRATKIAFSFPPVNLDLSEVKDYRVLGNPLRSKIFPTEGVISKKIKDLAKAEKINVLVMGGSQGARQINNMVLSSMNHQDIVIHFNFRVLTGTNLYEETREKSKHSIDLISYSQDMKTHYEWANLVIARSGAGVISECVLHGLPTILIPYPYAMDNHQLENAKYCEEFCGALMINQTSEDDSALIQILLSTIENKQILKDLSEKSLNCSKPNATRDTIEYFLSPESK